MIPFNPFNFLSSLESLVGQKGTCEIFKQISCRIFDNLVFFLQNKN